MSFPICRTARRSRSQCECKVNKCKCLKTPAPLFSHYSDQLHGSGHRYIAIDLKFDDSSLPAFSDSSLEFDGRSRQFGSQSVLQSTSMIMLCHGLVAAGVKRSPRPTRISTFVSVSISISISYLNLYLCLNQEYRTRRWRKFQNRKPI